MEKRTGATYSALRTESTSPSHQQLVLMSTKKPILMAAPKPIRPTPFM